MSIQRYDFNPISLIEDGYPETTPNNNDGQIVYYTDHAAEVERLTAERDAAVARAERAEAIIYDEAMDHRAHGFCDCPLCKFADALAAEPNHIGDVTKVVGFDAEEHDQMLRDLYADTPDKPQYAALAPEPWGGPEE